MLFWTLGFVDCILFVFWCLQHTAYFAGNTKKADISQKSIKVHYICHPLYGKEVEIIGHSTKGNERFYIISFFDNSKVYLPVWMTDPLVCQHCVIQDEAICSLTALRSLKDLLNNF